jgi:DNA-binding beta-propeller fold protein YncE
MIFEPKRCWMFFSTLSLSAMLLLAGCDSSDSSAENFFSGPFGFQASRSGPAGTGSFGGPNAPGPGTGAPVVFLPGVTEGALVSISATPNPISLTVGGTSQQLALTGTLDDGTVVSLVPSSQLIFEFTSDAPLIASVTGGGLVSPLAAGSATILAEVTTEGTTYSTTVPVTVAAAPPPPPPPPVNGLLFVSEELEDGGRVAAYDAETYAFVDSVATGGAPQGLGIDEVNLKVFVALRTSNQVAVIDVTDIGGTPDLVSSQGNGPFHVAYDSVHDFIFSPNLSSNSMGVAQASSPFALQGVPAVGRPAEVVIDTDRNLAYVTDNTAGSGINIVSTTAPFTTTFIDTTVDAAVPDAVAYGLDRIYVTHHVASNEIVALDANNPGVTPFFRVPTGGADPISVAVDTARQRLYVANSGSSTIAVLNALSGVPEDDPIELGVGAQPRTVIYDAVRDRIIAVNRGISTISVIDAANLLTPPQSFPVGSTPYAAVIAP